MKEKDRRVTEIARVATLVCGLALLNNGPTAGQPTARLAARVCVGGGEHNLQTEREQR